MCYNDGDSNLWAGHAWTGTPNRKDITSRHAIFLANKRLKCFNAFRLQNTACGRFRCRKVSSACLVFLFYVLNPSTTTYENLMRWSKTLHATLRDDPQEAEITSHKLLIRAGLIHKVSGGLYTFPPLGLRVLHKVENIVREEMDRAGAQEILMPALQPIELWETSGQIGRASCRERV